MEIDIDIDDIICSCSKREKKELYEALIEDGDCLSGKEQRQKEREEQQRENFLLMVGLVRANGVARVKHWEQYLASATKCIQQRILDIETAMTQKELDSTLQALHGQAIDGEDYISKPACRRPTEPEHYDPLNIIIQQGTAYCLSSEPKKKPSGALYSPCDLCALRYDCISDGGTEPLRSLCQLHQATDQEYYREVGRAQYAPAFGTIEVVDEMKELELEKKRLEEEDEE